MTDGVRIRYAPRPDITPDAELSALAACYRFLLDRGRTKEHACPGDPDDVNSLTNAEEVSGIGRRSR